MENFIFAQCTLTKTYNNIAKFGPVFPKRVFSIRIRKKNIIVALCIFELALNKKGVSGITNKK